MFCFVSLGWIPSRMGWGGTNYRAGERTLFLSKVSLGIWDFWGLRTQWVFLGGAGLFKHAVHVVMGVALNP